MKDLITKTNDTVLIDKNVQKDLKKLNDTVKALTTIIDEYKTKIKEEMEKKNIIKLESDVFTITYVESFDKETFDSKRFKAENKELYDEYVNIATVKPSIRIKFKDDK